jgi:hypothetical protein
LCLDAASFPDVREALWGLAASGALYVVGSLLWVQLVRLSWAEQPAELHPELGALRDQARDWKARSLLRPPERRSLGWLAGAVLVFAALWATKFGLLFQVLYVAALSGWWTYPPIRWDYRSCLVATATLLEPPPIASSHAPTETATRLLQAHLRGSARGASGRA